MPNGNWISRLAIRLLFFMLVTGSPGEARVYQCEIDAATSTGLVHKEIFGTNIEWFNNAGGLLTAGGRLDADLVNLARDQGLSVARFPGGTLSDFYHWENGIGSQSRRPVSPHHTDPGQSKNSFGSPELIRFCQLVGARPLITVNAGTGTADEAAAWVAYMNAGHNAARSADGFPDPVGVKLWEVGNELYLDGFAAEKKISLTPEQYAERFIAYADKMRSVDPDISLMAIGVAGSYGIPFGPHRDWNKILLSKAGDRIDYISLHNGYFPALYKQERYDAKTVYQALWGAPLAVARDFEDLGRLIKKYCRNRQPGIAVTEWGPLFSILDPEWRDHVGTMGSAVYVARMYQVFILNPLVRAAAYFKYTGQDFMAWVPADKTPRIPWYVVNMYARHFGTRLVHAAIETPVFNTRETGFAGGEKNVPVLNVISALDEAGDRLFVNIVSCSWNEELTVALKINNFDTAGAGSAVLRTLSAPSPLFRNDAAGGGPAHIGLEQTAIDPDKVIRIAPASVIMIEFKRATPVAR